jgi:hypothetical protein
MVTQVEPPVQDQLTNGAKELLLAAVKDQSGQIMNVVFSGGRAIHTNERNFVEPYSPRLEAKWLDAMEELHAHNLIRAESDTIYSVTNRGFEAADILESRTT